MTLPASLDMRRGLLGKGALMTVTSNAARTSPVTRGKWFLQTFLGVEPPHPPPDVPSLKERAADTTGNTKAPTMRQSARDAPHSPTCASCHQIFEPMGLALENFDAVGAWRTLDEGQPIDATGVLPDGTKVDGVVEPARVAGALSRSVRARGRREAPDLCARARRRVRGHADGALDRQATRQPTNYRFSSLVLGIVKSETFQMNMKAGERAEQRRRLANREADIICF